MKLRVPFYLIMTLLTAMLAGCASVGSSSFSCPLPSSGMCKPLHEVDKMQDLPGVSSQKPEISGEFGNFSSPYPASIITPGAPLRVQEEVMAVWLAPYQDGQGNYHEPNTIYTVIKPGHWNALPVQGEVNE